jgi:hypothetical protein
MWYTLHLRDKGAGMGAHIPQLRGLRAAGEEEEQPSRGFMFDTDDPEEMAKWRGWRRWVTFDAILLFWGITMLVTISFTVVAQSAARQSPDVVALLREGERSAALEAMSASFGSVGLPALGFVFLGFISLIGLNATLGLFDSFARGQSDMTYHFVPGAKRFRMAHLYAGFLWGVILFGICIILWGPVDGPTAILDVLAFLSTFAMGSYCIVLLLVNNRMLPKPIRPKMYTNFVIGFGAIEKCRCPITIGLRAISIRFAPISIGFVPIMIARFAITIRMFSISIVHSPIHNPRPARSPLIGAEVCRTVLLEFSLIPGQSSGSYHSIVGLLAELLETLTSELCV